MKSLKLLPIACLNIALLVTCSEKFSVTPDFLRNKITAADKFHVVNSLANPDKLSDGLILESIKSDDVNERGASEKWIYSFTSGGIAVTYFYHATNEDAALDSISQIVKLPPTQLISNTWMDSDEALAISKRNGGQDFRNKNPQNRIEARLAEPLGYNSPTFWNITFYSTVEINKKLSIVINASNGEIVP